MGSAWRLWTEDLVALGLSPNLHHHFEAYSATPPCEAYASRFGQVMGEISIFLVKFGYLISNNFVLWLGSFYPQVYPVSFVLVPRRGMPLFSISFWTVSSPIIFFKSSGDSPGS